MRLKLLSIFFFIKLIASAQNIDAKHLMGEWQAVQVSVPNADEVPQKEAIKFIEDAFLNAKFYFKGNTVFRIKYGTSADERIQELFDIDNQNWRIIEDKIQIGTENDGFSGMHITYQEHEGKTYFLLPMIRMEMTKLRDDNPSKPKTITAPTKRKQPMDYSQIELVNRELDASEILDFNTIKNPPLGPDCKSKWDTDQKKTCTKKYINSFVARKFNTELAAELGMRGKVRVVVEFIFDTTGKPINITASGGPNVLNDHAINCIGLLPNLKPGTKDGKPINVSYKLPITFQIME